VNTLTGLVWLFGFLSVSVGSSASPTGLFIVSFELLFVFAWKSGAGCWNGYKTGDIDVLLLPCLLLFVVTFSILLVAWNCTITA
jgi:hypothetical protein